MTQLEDPRHQRFLEWLLTLKKDRNPPTRAALAEEFGVHMRTLRDWEAREDFRKAHELGVRQVAGSPEKTQELLNKLHETAMNDNHRQHVIAAKAWLDAVGAISPQKSTVSVGDAKLLSNEELTKLITAAATEQAAARGLKLAASNGEIVD